MFYRASLSKKPYVIVFPRVTPELPEDTRAEGVVVQDVPEAHREVLEQAIQYNIMLHYTI